MKPKKVCENCNQVLPSYGCIMAEEKDGWTHKGPIITYVPEPSISDIAVERVMKEMCKEQIEVIQILKPELQEEYLTALRTYVRSVLELAFP